MAETRQAKFCVVPAPSGAGRDFGLKQTGTLHARFDRMWLASMIIRLAALAVYLGWRPTDEQVDRVARVAASFIKVSVYARAA